MNDSIYEKMSQISAREISEALEGRRQLSPAEKRAADANDDGVIDEQDVELMAQAEVRLADKISGSIVGMEPLTPHEKLAADRNGDGYFNLSDSYRLAEDARQARRITARLRHDALDQEGR